MIPSITEAKAEAWSECSMAWEKYLVEKARSDRANALAGEGWPVEKPRNPYL